MLKILTMFYLYGMAGNFFRRFTKRFFVFCNVAVAVVFLLGCYAAWFNPAHFWFVGFFTLASLYLLLVLIGFIVFWLFAKRKLMFISIIAIVLAWKPIGHILRLKPSKDFALAKQVNGIRVMTWNVEHFDILEHKTHPERKIEMLDIINKYEPDIACFQEMVGGDKDSTAINYLPTMAKQIHFENYFYAYSKLDDFDGKHHFGNIIFSKYPIIRKQILTSDKRNYNSSFQYIDILKNADTVRIFNLHLQSLKFSTDNLRFIKDAETTAEIDIEQSKNIISKFKTGFIKRKDQSENVQRAISESPYPVIVCGDFNDVPNSYAYCTIGKGLKNAFTEKGSGIGRTFSGISPTLRIDNIFVDKRFEVEQYTRVAKKLSDHFPVITDVRLAD
jgi:endonuclease/exonuclease/phosphatase family metal-dependent hydrolase